LVKKQKGRSALTIFLQNILKGRRPVLLTGRRPVLLTGRMPVLLTGRRPVILTIVGTIASIFLLWQLFSTQANLEKELPKTHLFKTVENYEAEVAKSGFLQEIAIKSGLSESAKITVCNLQYRCRHLQGNVAPTSAASLIKVPIAVALVNKLTVENIDLDTEIYVDEGNVTEEEFSSLEGGTIIL
jgi:hypothetical protein